MGWKTTGASAVAAKTQSNLQRYLFITTLHTWTLVTTSKLVKGVPSRRAELTITVVHGASTMIALAENVCLHYSVCYIRAAILHNKIPAGCPVHHRNANLCSTEPLQDAYQTVALGHANCHFQGTTVE